MSPCYPFSVDGMTGFVCSRGPKGPAKRYFCVACLRDGTKTPTSILCDFPLGPATTCDKAMCEAHRHRIRPGVDHCSDHPREVKP